MEVEVCPLTQAPTWLTKFDANRRVVFQRKNYNDDDFYYPDMTDNSSDGLGPTDSREDFS